MRNLKFTAVLYLIFSIIFFGCEKEKETLAGYYCDNGICTSVVGNAAFATLEACEESCSGGAGTVHCDPTNPTVVVDVLNPITGKIWMDRNLGASQVATSSTDAAAYGDLYQWGRSADGHQCRNSPATTALSSIDQPGNSNFILADWPPDWRSPQNDNLWQGVNGVNNPCPVGYRVPTDSELDAERLSWSSDNAAGAFASPLKLPLAGLRNGIDGSLFSVGTRSYYWSSTVRGPYSNNLYFSSSNANMDSGLRAFGLSVRCIKD
jgi:uncharacterized protein (TIGR02145 family)